MLYHTGKLKKKYSKAVFILNQNQQDTIIPYLKTNKYTIPYRMTENTEKH